VVLVRDPDIQEAFPLSEPQTSPPPLDGTHYREIACGLRKLAHQCRPASARRELLQSRPGSNGEPGISIVKCARPFCPEPVRDLRCFGG
jgi:hypothetical protein